VIESLYAASVVLILLAMALAATLVPWVMLFELGAILTAAGFLACLPSSAGYHLALYRNLRPCGPLPRLWWLSPTACHRVLPPDRRRRVLVWYYCGISAVTTCLLGCTLMLIATALAWRAA
jgi:hypothetical protein